MTFLSGGLCLAGSPRAVVFKLERASESPEGLVKTQIAAAFPPAAQFCLSRYGMGPQNLQVKFPDGCWCCLSKDHTLGTKTFGKELIGEPGRGIEGIVGVLWRQNSSLVSHCLLYPVLLPWKCLPLSHYFFSPLSKFFDFKFLNLKSACWNHPSRMFFSFRSMSYPNSLLALNQVLLWW